MNRILMFAYNINIMYLHDINTIFQTKENIRRMFRLTDRGRLGLFTLRSMNYGVPVCGGFVLWNF